MSSPVQLDSPVTAAPASLRALIERYDPDPIDLPEGGATIRIEVDGAGEWDVLLDDAEARLRPAEERVEPDARLCADEASWERIAADVRGGIDAFRAGRLRVRQNLHLGVGLLAATAGRDRPDRLRFRRVEVSAGELSLLEAGSGEPVVCIHGLGGTKASFLPTVGALAPGRRVIAVDLPGFGDSTKPIVAPYDAPYFAATVAELLDALGIERAHLVGNSMGGRIAIELGLRQPQRVGGVALLSPALAWLRDRPWRAVLSLPLPKLGLLQPTPRRIVEPLVRRLVPGGEDGWAAAGVDEFLRAFCTAGGRHAFYEAARRIYLDEPYGDDGFWPRLNGLECRSLFVWGRQDNLVPIGFRRHVEETLPDARHLELDCGHVPQLERPRETHAAIEELIVETGGEAAGSDRSPRPADGNGLGRRVAQAFSKVSR